jgi:hypothetical protein
MFKLIVNSICIIFPLVFLGQVNENVVIEVAGSRDLEPAYRIMEYPKRIDTVIPKSEIQYPLLSLRYETRFELENIEAAQVKLIQNMSKIYNSYAKIGIGNYFMPMADIYYNNTRSRKYMYGANLKHLSSFGEIKGYAPAQFSRTKANVFGGINEKDYTALGDFTWNNRGLHWYGFPDPNANRDSILQRFNEVSTQFSYASHKKDSNNLNYKIGLIYTHFGDRKRNPDSLKLWRGTENYVALQSAVWYKSDKHVFAADVDFKYNGYRYGDPANDLSLVDTSLQTDNLIISLKPTITSYSKDKKLKAEIGVDLTVDANDKTRFYIYPLAEVKYSLFDAPTMPSRLSSEANEKF